MFSFDNHELLRRHAAVIEHPELTEAVRDGSLRLGTLRLWIVACFALSLVPGLWLVAIGGPFALLLGAVGVLASAGYAGGRWPYTRWGLADPLLFLVMFGVVAVVGTWFAQAVTHARRRCLGCRRPGRWCPGRRSGSACRSVP